MVNSNNEIIDSIFDSSLDLISKSKELSNIISDATDASGWCVWPGSGWHGVLGIGLRQRGGGAFIGEHAAGDDAHAGRAHH